MHRWSRIGAITVLLGGVLVAGCATTTHNVPEATSTSAPVSIVASGGPVATIGQFTYDAPGDISEAATATAAITQRLSRELSSQWKNRPSDRASLPRSVKDVVRAASVQLVPVFSIDASAPVSDDLFAISSRAAHKYVVAVRTPGALVTAFDWDTPSPVAVGKGQDSRQGSFSGAFYLDFPGAEATLRSHFGRHAARVRYLFGPSGYWVVGRADNDEAAVFVGAQGEWPDGIQERHLYSVKEVLAYGFR